MQVSEQVLKASVDVVKIHQDGTHEHVGTENYKAPLSRRAKAKARRAHEHAGDLVDSLARLLFPRPRVPALADIFGGTHWVASVVTDVGKAIPQARMRGSGTEPKYIGWGTGAGTPSASDTTLSSEKDVDLSATSGTRTTGTTSADTTTVSNDTWKAVGTRTATGSGTVTNVGCFDNATIGSGTLYVSSNDFTSVAMVSGDALVITIKVKFA